MFTAEFIDKWVEEHTPALLEDLITITNIKSVAEFNSPIKPYGQGCQDVLNKMLSIGFQYGFSTKNYNNYVGCIELNDLEDDIGIWAHLDVVPEGDGWVYPPYEAQVKDGYVIGRGCQDNKSSAIVGLYAMRFLKEFNVPVKHNVKLYLGTCEEQGMYDLDYFVENHPCPNLSLVPDSGFPVCLGERGTFNGNITSINKFSKEVLNFKTSTSPYMIPDMAAITLASDFKNKDNLATLPEYIQVKTDADGNYTLTATGIAKNAAMPHGGDDALKKLLNAIFDCNIISEHDKDILRLCKDVNTNYDGTALNVHCTDEESGPIVLTCTTAEYLEDGNFKFSFISKYPISKNDIQFEALAKEACELAGHTLQVTRFVKATYFDPSNPIVDKITSVYNDYMGLNTKPFIMSGGTYARKLPNAFAFGTGMPLPKAPEGLFLPGHGDYHQPDEAISIVRMQKALAIYILTLLTIS
ncbi:MAG: Sapep family Mn(2+)-dependent dipeptidase [Lachnospiraceae bacterium]|nr:Sapep family Mn(2+)-dependent dipeptidase [Lachnospiraceae bacterium]